MAAQKKTSPINLLPNSQTSPDDLRGRIIAWVLSTFRKIIIVVELVVLIAFISRFYLDTKANQLNERIKTKSAEVQSFAQFEKEFKRAQEKLTIYELVTSKKQPADIISKITASVPPDVVLKTLSYEASGISIQASGITEQSITQFMANLKATNMFGSISLLSVDAPQAENSNGFLSFSLELTNK